MPIVRRILSLESGMTDTDHDKEDEVLRRMLKTPPKPHKENGGEPKPAPTIQKRVG